MSRRLKLLVRSVGWARVFEVLHDTSDAAAKLSSQFKLNMQPHECRSCSCKRFEWKKQDHTQGHDVGLKTTTILCGSCKHDHSKADVYDGSLLSIFQFSSFDSTDASVCNQIGVVPSCSSSIKKEKLEIHFRLTIWIWAWVWIR